MTAATVLPPYMIFPDADGNPLEGGFIYIGQPGFEARTTPKASYFDRGMTIPTGTATGAAIRTMQGFPIRNGSPAAFYVDGDYSITVCNRIGSVIYSSLYATTQFDRDEVSVADFGAVGDGTTNDQTAFNNALAATTGPVYVPWTSSFYVLSTLSAADRSRLYGPGEVRVAGTKVFIGSEPQVRDADGIVRAFDADWQPAKWSSVDGSLYNGAFAANLTRTGGFGTYGASLINVTVTDATPSPEFDVARTNWITHRNLTGGAVFSGWDAVIGPSPALGQTFSAGSVVGREINVGAREKTTFKDQPDSAKSYTGLKIVPDVGPSEDGPAYEPITSITIAAPGVLTRAGHGYHNGLKLRIYARTGTLPGGFTDGGEYFVVNATTDTFQLSATFGGTGITTTGSFAAGVAVLPSYPSHFGQAIMASIWGHQFHTGLVIAANAIMAGGTGIRVRGGDAATRNVGTGIFLDAFFTNGINVGGTTTNALVTSGTATNGLNLSFGTFSGAAILMASGNVVSWGAVTMAGTSGNLAITSTTGGLTIPRLTTAQRDAVGSWTDGTVIYNTTVPQFQGRVGGAWVAL